MLDLVGSGYVIDCVIAAANTKNREEEYRVYITDMLRAVVQCMGYKAVPRWYTLRHPPKEDGRTVQQKVDDIALRAGIKVVRRNECNDPYGDNRA